MTDDLPGSPVVKASVSTAGDTGCSPGWGTLACHVVHAISSPQCPTKKKKKITIHDCDYTLGKKRKFWYVLFTTDT